MTLFDLFDDAAWKKRAACRGSGVDVFFPEKRNGQTTARQARAICAGCPVRETCLDYALKHHDHYGVWGGMTDRQRRREWSRRQKEVA